MTPHSNTQLLARPLICFALVPIAGALGYGYARLTNNGFFLIGFLIPYIPCSLVACAVGTVFAVKAYNGLPPKHKGRTVLTIAITLTALVVVAFLALLRTLDSISGP